MNAVHPNVVGHFTYCSITMIQRQRSGCKTMRSEPLRDFGLGFYTVCFPNVKVGVFDAFSRSKSSGCRSDLNHYAVSGFLMEFPRSAVGFVKSIFPLFVEWM